MKKFKGFTLMELIVVIATIGVVLAIVLPTIIGSGVNPKITLLIIIVLASIGIIIGAIYLFLQFVGETNKRIATIIIAIVLLSLNAILGYYSLKPNLAYGKVITISWNYEITIQKKYKDSDGDTHYKTVRTITTNGTDHSPYWGEYTLAQKESIGRKTQNYYICVWNGDQMIEYSCSYDDWMKLNPEDEIEFEYQYFGNYITRIY